MQLCQEPISVPFCQLLGEMVLFINRMFIILTYVATYAYQFLIPFSSIYDCIIKRNHTYSTNHLLMFAGVLRLPGPLRFFLHLK